jgi:hypothetical protein
MIIYSPDNRWRARLSETPEGIRVAFDRFAGVIERRGVNVSTLDPADLPPILWRQVETGLVDNQPFHTVREHVHRVLTRMPFLTPRRTLPRSSKPTVTLAKLITNYFSTYLDRVHPMHHLRVTAGCPPGSLHKDTPR